VRTSRIWMGRGGRRFVSFVGMCAAFAMLAGCATKGESGEPTSSPAPSIAKVLALGETFTTPLGNTVTVFAFDPSVAAGATPPPSGAHRTAADVKVCAGEHPTERTGTSPGLFYVEVEGEIAYRAVPPVKKPALESKLLAAGTCARGWATFNLPTKATPKYVLFISSQQAKWRIE